MKTQSNKWITISILASGFVAFGYLVHSTINAPEYQENDWYVVSEGSLDEAGNLMAKSTSSFGSDRDSCKQVAEVLQQHTRSNTSSRCLTGAQIKVLENETFPVKIVKVSTPTRADCEKPNSKCFGINIANVSKSLEERTNPTLLANLDRPVTTYSSHFNLYLGKEGCVVSAPDGKVITIDQSKLAEGYQMMIPKGSTISGDCIKQNYEN